MRSEQDLHELAGEFDTRNMESVIERLPDQIVFALSDPGFPTDEVPKGPYDKVVIAGMGGSSIMVDMLIGAFPNDLRIPLVICRNYRYPSKINSSTLCIASSFSGNTEETIDAAEQMIGAGAKLVVLTSGGQLEKFASRFGCPVVLVPAGREGRDFQPRCAVGYMISYLARVLAAAGITEQPIKKLALLPSFLERLDIRAEAEKLAVWLEDRVPIIYTDDLHERSIARVMKIKFNENAKRPAFFNSLPEINHNEMIGFEGTQGKYAVIYLRDPSSHDGLHRRFKAMERIFRSRKFDHIRFREWTLVGSSNLEKIFAANNFSDWCTYTTALLDGIDPTPVSLLEKFKVELASTRWTD